MRILIDECLDWRLCRALAGHDCSSVQKMGWGGLTNGALLERAEKEFDVFVTGDRNLSFQQKVSSFNIARCGAPFRQHAVVGHATSHARVVIASAEARIG
jgi:hypothetical protein